MYVQRMALGRTSLHVSKHGGHRQLGSRMLESNHKSNASSNSGSAMVSILAVLEPSQPPSYMCDAIKYACQTDS